MDIFYNYHSTQLTGIPRCSLSMFINCMLYSETFSWSTKKTIETLVHERFMCNLFSPLFQKVNFVVTFEYTTYTVSLKYYNRNISPFTLSFTYKAWRIYQTFGLKYGAFPREIR